MKKANVNFKRVNRKFKGSKHYKLNRNTPQEHYQTSRSYYHVDELDWMDEVTLNALEKDYFYNEF